MMVKENPSSVRIGRVIDGIGWPRSSFYHRRVAADHRRPKGPAPDPIPGWMTDLVCGLAHQYPFWGSKRMAVICRRDGYNVSNNKTYRIFQLHHLLTKKKPRDAEIYQAAKLFRCCLTARINGGKPM